LPLDILILKEKLIQLFISTYILQILAWDSREQTILWIYLPPLLRQSRDG